MADWMRQLTHPLLVPGEVVVPQTRVNTDDPVGGALSENRMASVFGVSDILLDKSNVEHFFSLVLAPSRGRRHSTMEERVELFENWSLVDTGFRLITADIEILNEIFNCGGT